MEARSCTEQGTTTIHGIGTIITRVLRHGDSVSTTTHGLVGPLVPRLVGGSRTGGLPIIQEQFPRVGGGRLATVLLTDPSSVPRITKDTILHIIR